MRFAPTHAPRSAARRVRAGLSLVEVMISLAICASLLTAVGAAYNASAQAIATNDRFYRASQSARVSMLQLQKAIRTCNFSHVGNYSTYAGAASVSSNELHVTRDGVQKTYVFDAATGKLRLYHGDTVSSPTAPWNSLASNISSLTFTADMEIAPSNSGMRPVRITIDMVVTVGSDSVHLTGAAVPRYTLSYN